MNEVALVTGASRGIGRELCAQLLAGGATVIACARRPGGAELARLAGAFPGRLHELSCDVGDAASVETMARAVAERVDHVDLLFNNAGVYPREGALDTLDFAAMEEAFRINAVAPLRMARALLPLLQRGTGRRVINVTSLMGSIGDNSSGGSYAYRMSKAALNMATRNLAHELGSSGFTVIALHPGWVRTAMGGAAAPLEVEAAVSQILATVRGAEAKDHGGFLGADGRGLPW
jgi:NAD(P)-dependent dehydrogenase (short-subunit alcohol dehydrogenase family)